MFVHVSTLNLVKLLVFYLFFFFKHIRLKHTFRTKCYDVLCMWFEQKTWVGVDIWVKFEENPSISIDLIMEMDRQTDRRDKANPL